MDEEIFRVWSAFPFIPKSIEIIRSVQSAVIPVLGETSGRGLSSARFPPEPYVYAHHTLIATRHLQ
jgi:hypothetical protein